MTKENILKNVKRIRENVNSENIIGPLTEAKQFLSAHVGKQANYFIESLTDVSYKEGKDDAKLTKLIRQVLTSFIDYVENDLITTSV